MRVEAPPPPMEAPNLWSTAAKRDKLVEARPLPFSSSHEADLGCPLVCVALPEGKCPVSPKASNLACRPALENTGWLSRRVAASAATVLLVP